ncbi:MAG: hypothetical protein LT106_05285 [Burkholderiaceae bacterium]|nr:hypothetical protein [Burkholderiaceae bacterium]
MILLARIACGWVIEFALTPLRALSFVLAFACVRSEPDEACELPDIALPEGVAVFDDDALGLLLGLEVLFDCAKVAPLKARAENSTPAEMRCLPFGFMNFSYIAPGRNPGPEPCKTQCPYPWPCGRRGKHYAIEEPICRSSRAAVLA